MTGTATPAPLLHVGLHKTGTTWLQRNLFERRDGDELAYCGDIRLIYSRFVVPSAREFDPATARAPFAGLFETAARTGRLPVLSAEGLAGRPFHQKHYREIVAERLARAFPDAHILLTIREQSAIIYSMYGQYLRFGYSSSLEDFLAIPPEGEGFQPVLDRSFYDYDRLIDDFARWFPPERITVLPFEWIIADPEAAIGRLAARLGRPLTAVDRATAERPANPAWSDLAYETLRLMNRLTAQDSRWARPRSRLGPNAMANRVDRLTPGGLRKRMRARRMALIAGAIGDLYAASNAAAAARIDVDLGRFGYRVG